MQVAKIENGVIGQISTLIELFPNVSFPSNGIPEDFMETNFLVPIKIWEEYNPASEKLIQVEPYLKNREYKIVNEFKGEDIVGLEYERLYDIYSSNDKDFKVYSTKWIYY